MENNLTAHDHATPHHLPDAGAMGMRGLANGPWALDAGAAMNLFAVVAVSCDDAIITTDMDDRITSWNPGAERLHGYAAAEMLNQPSMRLVPREYGAEMHRIQTRLQRGERVDHVETVRLRKDGSRVDVLVSMSPLRDAMGHLVGATAVARDITERKRAERELAARARQQAAMEDLRRRALTSADISALMDEAVALVARTLDVPSCAILERADAGVLRVRAGAGWAASLVGQVITGPDVPVAHTSTADETADGADRARGYGFRDQAVPDLHGPVGAASVVMGHPERPVGLLEVQSTQQRVFTTDDMHFLRAVANLLTTVGMRTAAEEALRVSERRYRAIFEQSPSGLILYAPDGVLLDANQAVRGDLPPDMVKGYNVLADQRFVVEGVMDDIRRAFAGEIVQLPALPAQSTPTPTSGQMARWVQPFLYPLKDEAGAVREIVAILQDVTEQRQAVQLLERRVEARTQELSTLLEVSNDVASTLELQPLLALILDHIRSVVDYTGATIYILEREHLMPLDYRGPLPRDQVTDICFPIDQAVGYQEALRRRGPVLVDDLWGDAPVARAMRDGAAAPLYAQFAYARSFMEVLLMVKERVIGAVVIDHSVPHAYSPRHAQLVQAIANQAAVAIENARLYTAAQQMAVSEERARLARELHDSVTQMLFSSSIIADVLPRLWRRDEDEGQQYLDALRLLTRGALAEMRTLLLELRPAALQEADLGELVRHLAEAITGRTGLAVTVTVEGQGPVPPDVKITLYRLAQESLNNIAKHAGASLVAVSLRTRPEDVELCVTDDGRGFDPTSVAPECFGLSIMRERAEGIGALLSIDSAPGRGARVLVRWTATGAPEGL